jgi:beta-galactosidase
LAEHGTTHTVSFHGDNQRFAVADDEVVLMNGGEILGQYHGENLEGHPAISLHPAGHGFVVYVSFTSRQDAFFDALFATLARKFSIVPLIAAPNGVDVVSRAAGQSEYIFLLNNTQQPCVIDLPQSLPELLTNSRTGKRLSLAPLQLAILERPLIG